MKIDIVIILLGFLIVYVENQYIFITGISNNQEETIEWKIEKI